MRGFILCDVNGVLIECPYAAEWGQGQYFAMGILLRMGPFMGYCILLHKVEVILLHYKEFHACKCMDDGSKKH